jgi:hyperosmotically inducible periplasmic protein
MEINKNMKATLLSIGAIAALLLGGCSQEAKNDMAAAGDAASTAASKTGEAVATDTKKAGEAVENAGEAVVETTKDAAENAADAAMSPKVKTALQASSGLETKDIDVDTANNTIHLKGSVPSEDQKKQAQKVAEGVAGKEYKVSNELTVSGATGATSEGH